MMKFLTKGMVLLMVYAWVLALALAGTILLQYQVVPYAVFCFVTAGLTGIIFPMAMIDLNTNHIQSWVSHIEYAWEQRPKPKKLTKQDKLDRLLNDGIEERL